MGIVDSKEIKIKFENAKKRREKEEERKREWERRKAMEEKRLEDLKKNDFHLWLTEKKQRNHNMNTMY